MMLVMSVMIAVTSLAINGTVGRSCTIMGSYAYCAHLFSAAINGGHPIAGLVVYFPVDVITGIILRGVVIAEGLARSSCNCGSPGSNLTCDGYSVLWYSLNKSLSQQNHRLTYLYY